MAEEADSDSGDSTDVFSEKFDSFKALYSDKVNVPVPDAPIFDNISKFESVVLKGCIIKASDSRARLKKEGESSVRRFLPHQESTRAVNDQRQQRFSEKNVINRMQKALGPLAVLYLYMENKIRVKVYTRNANGLRGHVEAYVAAFDRHWNLALEDCLELWSRKIKRKAPALGIPVSEMKYTIDHTTKTIVKESNGKLETLERHVPQLLLRGEQVALIVKID
ncbi:PREDICTED: U7 snRNA-associated Sm-like protein LSm11 [Ceratosolen solmsi marchali]|uniref:U7 snRNA-associated Sm-like protein LSm11 n=1 Tax=Ceratosolen solmsi marchali TaxID=326594 RepID=A0AAJ6YY87_9HYME|nr:PREDICTED: U7 snRNA-associated Sm-like protein LSm11 [Ceratosolen solmsi marchali]